MNKRPKTDTVKGALATLQDAQLTIAVPPHVNVPTAAMPFWLSITKARATSRWTEPDLEMAAELARTKYKIEILNTDIQVEGDTVKNARGTLVENPKHRTLETLTRRMIALSRALHIHAEATQGRAQEQVKPNKAQAKARNAAEALDNDLIPGIAH